MFNLEFQINFKEETNTLIQNKFPEIEEKINDLKNIDKEIEEKFKNLEKNFSEFQIKKQH